MARPPLAVVALVVAVAVAPVLERPATAAMVAMPVRLVPEVDFLTRNNLMASKI